MARDRDGGLGADRRLALRLSDRQAEARHRSHRRHEDHVGRPHRDALCNARAYARNDLRHFPGARSRQAADSGLFRRHGIQLPQRRRAFRSISGVGAQARLAGGERGATIIINNQSQFNGAADKLRMLADRQPGERHPLESAVPDQMHGIVIRTGGAAYHRLYNLDLHGIVGGSTERGVSTVPQQSRPRASSADRSEWRSAVPP